jgi:peroxiredoxin
MGKKIINEGTIAPDFKLEDTNDNSVQLSQFRDKKIIVLVFNRGFS